MNVTPSVKLIGTATATTTDPAAITIPAGSTQRFQWTYHATGTGSLGLGVTAQGSDKLSGLLVTTSTNLLGSSVVLPAALSGVVQFPSVLNTSQSTTLTYTVKNTGQATAKAVTATATIGGTTLTSTTSPDILPAATASLTFPAYQAPATPGIVDISVSASGTDANGNFAVSSGPTAASAKVQTPASLAMDISAPATVNVNQSFQVTVTAINSGDSGATVSIPAPTVAGAGAASPTPTVFNSQTVPGQGRQAVVFLYTATATGSLTLTANASGTDSTDQSTVTATPKTSPSLLVQTPSQVSATLAIPGTLPLGDNFAASMTVTNSGEATANLLVPAAPLVDAGSKGGATLVSGPTAGSALALAGQFSQVLTWNYTAAKEGSLQLDGQITGTDANDQTPRSASTASGVSPIAEAVTMGADPFGDGITSFASLASFSGQLWLGPSANGGGAVRMNGDGSSAQRVPWQLEHPAAANNAAWSGPAQTIGSKGCAPGSTLCGPNNESGHGLFFSTVISGMEWLGVTGAQAGSGTDYARYLYLTNPGFPLATGSYTDLT
ncbi:MAG TPA: CARDB domain-containing protein, partial [Mycobacteriales bacterium]|nr:CARDB domain-containing protein [Mycobacteriales bacterium]